MCSGRKTFGKRTTFGRGNMGMEEGNIASTKFKVESSKQVEKSNALLETYFALCTFHFELAQ
jgi:hypothetical protein